MALGHTCRDMSLELGWRMETLNVVLSRERLRMGTAAAIDHMYRRRLMVVPTGPKADRSRQLSASKGYVPPLAWDNIDDPNENPTRVCNDAQVKYDWVVVDRILGGEPLRATKREQKELWVARNWSDRDFERMTGGNAQRMRKILGPSGPSRRTSAA